jgi:hypothetical protein
MITGMWMKQFKAFDECELELRPLTVFLGENNSGKSSLLAALRLLAQTVQGQDQTIPLALNAALGDFGSFRDVVHGNHRGRPIGLGLSFTDRRPRADQEYYFDIEFKHRVQTRDTILRRSELGVINEGRYESLLRVNTSRDAHRPGVEAIDGQRIAEAARGSISRGLRMFNFLPRVIPDLSETSTRSTVVREAQELIEGNYVESRRSYLSALRNLQSIEYLGAMRRAPERTYVNTGVIGRKIGADGSGWPSVLALESPRRRQIGTATTSWMRNAGIAESVSIAWLSDRHYEIVVTNPHTGEKENIADVGQGTSQVLPVIVGGTRLRSDDTFIVEEPEIHLHPRAQASLGDYFCGLVDRGVQCLIETHSEYLLLRLQQKVAAGELDADSIIFYYVTNQAGAKKVISLTLDESASFNDQLPGGFFPQRVGEARKLVAARGSGIQS